MGNCLKTQLKEAVNNSNLDKMGDIKIHLNVPNNLKTQYQNKIEFYSNAGGITIKLTNNKNMYEYVGTTGQAGSSLGNTYTLTNAGKVICFPEVGEYDLIITPKYNVLQIVIDSMYAVVDAGYFKYAVNLTRFESQGNVTGNITSIYNGVQTLGLNNTLNKTTNGTVDEIMSKFSNLTSLTLATTSNITGLFDKFGTKPAMAVSIASTKISGSVEGYVKNAVAALATSGSKSLPWLGTNNGITFGGMAIASQRDNSLAWEPAATSGHTKITFNGVEEEIVNSTGEIVS